MFRIIPNSLEAEVTLESEVLNHGVLYTWRGQYGRVITLRGLIRHRYELFIQIIENALFCILLMLQMV